MADSRLVAGSATGEVAVFDLRGLTCDPAICTAVRAEDGPAEPFLRCPWCGRAGAVPAQALQAIAERPDHPLPDSIFDDDRLRIDCVDCGRPIQLNPFLAEQEHPDRPPEGFVRRLLRWLGMLRDAQ